MPAIGPLADASVVAMTRRAGGIVIGKTVTTEMASLVPSITRNPHNLGAYAGRLVVRIGRCRRCRDGADRFRHPDRGLGHPARQPICGVAGFKPSYRLIPMVGVKDVSWHLDTAGVFGAGVADVAFAAARVLEPRPARRSATRQRTAHRTDAHAFVAAGEPGDAAGASKPQHGIAEAAGAQMSSDLTLPPILEDAYAAQYIVQDYENFRALAFEYDHHYDKIDPRLREQLDAAAAITAGRLRCGAPDREPRTRGARGHDGRFRRVPDALGARRRAGRLRVRPAIRCSTGSGR